ncbi:nuclear transport factor 2 family protein [Actinokineospora auranticolor]|uniref:Ketosteroid isomerase-like protein n=1 Tax=Actinokineospora auranticolor TaxID=155976 RepID=A0A2S6GS74_9PSEU|nr:nuclear transport factor 2 family protein [Actinokineospora auranticolor]PPK68049.1 ketosteroid isomerase-like protein [Actinokineospora auranticolor]
MGLGDQDRIDITDLVNRHGHLCDAGELDRLGELFTPDVTYDVTDFGFGTLRGVDAIREAAIALGDGNPVGRHVTNIVITEVDDRTARVRAKGLGVLADGSAGSVVYDDTATRTPDGWRISYRKVTPRRLPLGREDRGAVEVLESWRQAVVGQSVEGLRRVYAVDAVHEFPFVYPGVPSRFEGREEIVGWVEAGWRGDLPRYQGYRTLALHHTSDPATIVVEQEAFGVTPAGEFTLPNIVVLTVRNGQIGHVRDYVDVMAAAAVLGQKG